MFYHQKRQIRVYVHGDDFVAVGDREQVSWLDSMLKKAYQIKSRIVGGGGLGEVKQTLSLIHNYEPTRPERGACAVFCLNN